MSPSVRSKWLDIIGQVIFLFLMEQDRVEACSITKLIIVCEQALQAALVAGWEKEGGLATTSPEFEFHLQFPFFCPSTELSDFYPSAQSGNKCECKQTLKITCQG